MPLYNMHGLQLTQAGYDYLMQRRAERGDDPNEDIEWHQQPQQQAAEQSEQVAAPGQ